MKWFSVFFIFGLAACRTAPKLELDRPTVTGKPAVEIYGALNVPEVEARAEDEFRHAIPGAAAQVKAVGGLTCTKLTIIRSDALPTYSCELSAASNAEAIYNAINADEKDARAKSAGGIPLLGTRAASRSVGALTCKKSLAVSPNAKPNYDCTLQR